MKGRNIKTSATELRMDFFKMEHAGTKCKTSNLRKSQTGTRVRRAQLSHDGGVYF